MEEEMKKFDGNNQHEWPAFAKKLLAIGGIRGGWDDALEKQLDLKDAVNQKLNKQAWSYLTIMMEGEALRELDIITSKNVYEAWEHLKTKYEPKDDKAYANLEMKFAQCELESPRKNPEKWINELIQINNRIANCHSTQKKSDVMMIAHILSKLTREEKYYKIFIAMTRRFGYSTQTIWEFKKSLYDYWENNIKQEDEDQELDGEAYAIYERAGNGAKKLGKKIETKGEEKKQHFQNSGNKDQPNVMGQVIWTQTGPMVIPMGMMGQGHDSTIIKDSMSELVIMESRPGKMDG